MSTPKKWWLISDEDVQMIRTGLTARTDTRRRMSEALHALDSGLHKTEEIPDDWKKEAEVYFKQMTPFFRAMAQTMAKAHKEKGASWKTCSIGYLLDRASNQFEDLGNRPGEEDYMANLANYAYMLWRHEQAAQGKLPLDFGEAEV